MVFSFVSSPPADAISAIVLNVPLQAARAGTAVHAAPPEVGGDPAEATGRLVRFSVAAGHRIGPPRRERQQVRRAR